MQLDGPYFSKIRSTRKRAEGVAVDENVGNISGTASWDSRSPSVKTCGVRLWTESLMTPLKPTSSSENGGVKEMICQDTSVPDILRTQSGHEFKYPNQSFSLDSFLLFFFFNCKRILIKSQDRTAVMSNERTDIGKTNNSEATIKKNKRQGHLGGSVS